MIAKTLLDQKVELTKEQRNFAVLGAERTAAYLFRLDSILSSKSVPSEEILFFLWDFSFTFIHIVERNPNCSFRLACWKALRFAFWSKKKDLQDPNRNKYRKNTSLRDALVYQKALHGESKLAYDKLIEELVRERLESFSKSQGRKKVPNKLRKEVFERDEYRCQHCGDWHDLCIDHIYPESKGGPTKLDNLQTLCQKCNTIKGARI